MKKYVTGENKKGEKNDDQTKQSLKKEIRKMGATEGETFKNENSKRKMFKNKLEYIKKVKFRNKDKHAKTNKCETSAQQKGIGKQTHIFSDSQQFHKLFFREVMDRANKRRNRETNV